jgi:multisubunit Na+/H+ antiporter MnhB subunit
MLISAPFDNWWHDAYGVDVKILSPPHTVLALGMWAVVLGAQMLVLREQNLAPSDQPAPGRYLFIYASGLLIVMASVFLIEHSWPNQQHTDPFYKMSAATFPLYLLGMGRASKFRWGATWIALWYMAILALLSWILPLFPGQPRLGPIYNPIRNFVPLPFPLLLFVPAIGIDLLRGWIGQGRGWKRDWALAIAAGIAFMTLFLVTQWFFSRFLISHYAQNWFFAADRHCGYQEPPGDWHFKYWDQTSPKWNPPVTAKGLAIAFVLSIVAARLGLWLGNWKSRVRR